MELHLLKIGSIMRYRNNPLNIRYSASNRWSGLLGCDNGFCTFTNMRYGFRAAWLVLKSYRRRGIKTLSGIIKTWAPPGENDSVSYTDFVSKKMKFFPWDELSSEYDYVRLVYYMAWFEQGSLLELPPLIALFDIKRWSKVNVI